MAQASMVDTLSTPATAQRPSAAPKTETRAGPGLREVLWIWGVLGVLTLAVTITYAIHPVSEFYNVSRSGAEGGFGRALVLLNFPISFMAIALMGVVLARLYRAPDALGATGRWLVGIIAIAATGMCLVTAFVVQQSNLDAKPANLIPAFGVLIALGLTGFAVRRTGVGAARNWTRADHIRVVAIVVLVIPALPWILADASIFVGDIPLIGSPYMSKAIPPGETLSAVHLGHHHGLDGVLFAVIAIVLSRQLDQIRGQLRWPLTVYLAFMFTYGVVNAAQDFWGEQLVKRGTTAAEFPSMVLPKLTPAWGLLLLATALVTVILFRMTRSDPESADSGLPA
jgi:hypothetical protein